MQHMCIICNSLATFDVFYRLQESVLEVRPASSPSKVGLNMNMNRFNKIYFTYIDR
jgi:hypothetical protein